jgi:CO/xanthine dehydrogenase Mo-binding subunit
MQDSGTAIRHAAAQARTILVGLAAERLGVAADGLHVANGVIAADGGHAVTYAELVAANPLHVEAAPASTLREPARHKVVGRSMRRVDIPAKVTGGPAYVQDLRFDGMVHGRIVRSPARAAALAGLDADPVKSCRAWSRSFTTTAFSASSANANTRPWIAPARWRAQRVGRAGDLPRQRCTGRCARRPRRTS